VPDAPSSGRHRQLERCWRRTASSETMSKPILEVNGSHALSRLWRRGSRGAPSRGNSSKTPPGCLYDEARLMDGEQPADAAAFAAP